MKLNLEEKVDDQLANTLLKDTRPLIITLASLWTEIGLTSAEVEERCGVVDTEVVGLLEQMVAEEERNKESLITRRLKLKFQTQNLAEQMNIICDEQPNSERTLRDQVLNLCTLLEKLNKEKDKRLSQWHQLKIHNEQYCRLLAVEVEVPRLEDELLDDSELVTRELPPSLSQLELFELQVNSLSKQLQEHRKIVSEMKSHINTLVSQLQYQVLLKSEQSMIQALSESSVVSNDVMNKHHSFINKLNATKHSNKQQITALKQQLKSGKEEEEEEEDVKNILDDDASFKTLTLLQQKLARREAIKAQAKRQVTPKRYGRSKSTTPCLTPTSRHNQVPEVSTARRSLKNKLAYLTPSKIAAKLKIEEGDKWSKDKLLTPKNRTDTPKRRAPSTPNLKGPSASRTSHICLTPQPFLARPSRNRLREVTESEQRKLVRKPPINKNNKPTNNLNPTKPNNNDFRHYLMEKENIASSYEEFTRGLRECDRDFISSSILVPPCSQRVPKSPFHLS